MGRQDESRVGLAALALALACVSSAGCSAPAAPPAGAGATGAVAGTGAPGAAPSPAPAKKSEDPALPVDRLKLPPGFAISVWASGVANARSLTQAPGGIVFVGTREGDSVIALRDADGDGRAEQRRVVASGMKVPNGVAVKDGALYVAEISRILRVDGAARVFDAGFEIPKPVVVTDQYPTDGWHGWKFIAFGPDGWLYVPVGAPCNTCDPAPPFASITRIKQDGSGREVFARGLRNTVGFDWHPVTKELWFTDNGPDYMGEDLPSDELDRAPKAGLHFGFPYCHQGDVVDAEYGKGKSCADYVPPEWKMGPHVAALGMRFYTGSMFPGRYRNQIVVAEHGSWNRTAPIGYRVVVVFLDADGRKALSSETLVDGFLDSTGNAWGRPVDVLVLPDGSLLVSDDKAGAIYRVTSKG